MNKEEEKKYSITIRKTKNRIILFFRENDTVLMKVYLKNPKEKRILEEDFEKIGEDHYATSNYLVFLKTMVYYGVAQWTRDPFKKERIMEILDEQSGYDIRFWANQLWTGYTSRGIRGLSRPARAFKVLFNV